MAAITRLGLEGYGVRRAGSFAGKTASAPIAPGLVFPSDALRGRVTTSARRGGISTSDALRSGITTSEFPGEDG